MIEIIKKRILLSIAIAAAVYLALTIYLDYSKVLESFANFNWLLLPLLLILSLANYLTRFLKWQYYLNLINIRLKLQDSFSIFMSGLIMSVTPGKFGELLKAYLVKQVNGTQISKTVPIIFAERATDFLSLTFIAIIGAYYFDYGKSVILIILFILILLIIIISNKIIADKILVAVSKISYLNRYIHKIKNAYDSSFVLLNIKSLILMTLLSIISWGFECLGFYFIINNFSQNINLVWSFFTYSFSTIVGAVSMLPGGIGVTEGSLTLMLINKGLSNNDALASTFIIRVVTLWFAVLVGIISVVIYQKRYGRIAYESNIDNHNNA